MPDLPTFRAHLARDAAAVGAALSTVDPDAAVPGCPGWTVRDLGHHLGGVHRWAAEILRTGELADDPVPTGDMLDWYATGWPALLDALAHVPADAPCWGMGPPPRTAGFWTRRMAHETALHLVDLQLAAGATVSMPAWSMPANLAADGIAEVVEVFYPRQVRLGRCAPLAQPVVLESPAGRWQLGAGDPVATVRGPPLDLLLWLWHRRTDDGLEIQGPADAVAAVSHQPIVP